MNIKANKKNILVGIIVVIIIGIIGIVCYDRITVNNQYYIGEKMRDNDAKATAPYIMGCLQLGY